MFLTNFYENMKIVPLFHLLTPSPFPITIQIMKYFCSFCTIFRTVKYKMKPKENKLLLHARYQECLDQTCKFFTYFQVISYSSIVLFGRWDLNTRVNVNTTALLPTLWHAVHVYVWHMQKKMFTTFGIIIYVKSNKKD